MRYLLLAPAIIFLIGCGSKSANQEKTEAASAPTQKSSGEVTLEADAQRLAGIVVHEVRSTSVAQTISANGQLAANEDQTWNVGALVEGRVVEVLAKVGDSVRQGQILARIHSHDVHDSRAEYQRARSEVTRAQSIEVNLRKSRDRARRLFDLKSASQHEVEMAENELRNATAAVAAAEAELEKAKTHLTEFLDVPAEETGDKADFVPVRAPAAGTVTERKATPGSVVSAGDPVLTISNMSSLWMIANVAETDLTHVRPGMPVRVFVRAFPQQPIAGRVLRLGEALDPATRTLRVRVLTPNTSGLLRPEMFATAEIARPASRAAIFIPDSAAQELNGNRVVFVRTSPNGFRPRPIQVARAMNGQLEIVAGLKLGEQIVTSGAFILKTQMLKSSLVSE